MAAKLACLAGGPLEQALTSGAFQAQPVTTAETPFGHSETVLLVEEEVPFYLVPRQLPGSQRRAPWSINFRATLYALKELGVQAILSWSAAGAISHNLGIGDVLVPGDVIDLTRRRETTFFERSGLGVLRQFPVFCPALAKALERVLCELNLPHHVGSTVAVTEGPRLETPAEVRMLGTLGAELVTHTLVPEVFLAKELQMCLVGGCYLVSYAETGSRHRPFTAGDLFGGLVQTGADRVCRVVQSLPQIIRRLARLCQEQGKCECAGLMAGQATAAGLDEDWRKWF